MKTKKIVAILLALAMMASLFPVSALGVTIINYAQITEGQTAEVDITRGGDREIFCFVPDESATYFFYSTSDEDTMGEICDSGMGGINFDDNDLDGHNFRIEQFLEKDQVYLLCASYHEQNMTGKFTVTVEKAPVLESPVAGIEIVEGTSRSYLEGSDGHYESWHNPETERDEETFFYHAERPDNVVVRIHYENDTWRDAHVNEYVDGYRINWNDCQYEKPWHVGNDNETVISYYGKTVSLYVTVEPNPVKSIELLDGGDHITCYENSCGRMSTHWNEETEQEEEFFEYDPWDVMPRDAQIRINYTDGSKRTVRAGDEVDGERMATRTEDQYTVPWTKGADNTFEVGYFGRFVTVHVELIENPVKSIELVNAPDTMDWIEYAGAFKNWRYNPETDSEEEYLEYDLWRLGYSDAEVRINYNDGRSCVARVGEEVDGTPIKIDNRQFDKPWAKGEDNTFAIEYLGKTITIHVNLIDNPVESIELVDAPDTMDWIEYAGAFKNWRYNPETDSEEEYLEYDLWRLGYSDAEVRINYTDDSSRIARIGEMVDGETVDFDNRQFDKPWAVGEDNTFDIKYLGKTITIHVNLIDNPVKSIELVDAPDTMDWIEYAGAFKNWRYNPESDSEEEYLEYDLWRLGYSDAEVRINYTDGSSHVVRVGEEVDGESVYFDHNQYDKHWAVGEDNTFDIVYLGRSVTIHVNLLENPVDRIELAAGEPSLETVEFIGGRMETRWNGETEQDEPFFLYDLWDLGYGDAEIRIFYKNGTERIARVGDEIDGEYVTIQHDQYDDPWTVGGDNAFWISYFGKSIEIPVTITENPVASIEINTAPTVEYIYGDLTYGYFNEEGEYQLAPTNVSGLTFTVHYKDETSEVIELNDGVPYDLVFDNSGAMPGQFPVTLIYMGQSAQYVVDLKESDVESITVAKLPDKSSFEANRYPDWTGAQFLIHYTNGQEETVTITGEDGRYNILRGDLVLEFHVGENLGLIVMEYNEAAFTATVSYRGKSCAIEGLEIVEGKPVSDVQFSDVNLEDGSMTATLLFDDETREAVTLDHSIDIGYGMGLLYTMTEKGFFACAVMDEGEYCRVILPGLDTFVIRKNPETDTLKGDLDGDGVITDGDAIYLLMYTFFPENYPIDDAAAYDLDGDGVITDGDAIYLLMHTFFPKDYPIG